MSEQHQYKSLLEDLLLNHFYVDGKDGGLYWSLKEMYALGHSDPGLEKELLEIRAKAGGG